MVGPDGWFDRGLDFRVLRHLGANAGPRAILDMALRGLSVRTRHCNPRRRCDRAARVTDTSVVLF